MAAKQKLTQQTSLTVNNNSRLLQNQSHTHRQQRQNSLPQRIPRTTRLPHSPQRITSSKADKHMNCITSENCQTCQKIKKLKKINLTLRKEHHPLKHPLIRHKNPPHPLQNPSTQPRQTTIQKTQNTPQANPKATKKPPDPNQKHPT
jgi:hypothetical protein